jgi:hypothetical protein
MGTVFSELLNYTGVTGVFVYHISQKKLLMHDLPDSFQAHQIERYLTTSLEQQQRWMNFSTSVEVFQGLNRTLLLLKHESFKIGCVLDSADVDHSFIQEKILELLIRYKLTI